MLSSVLRSKRAVRVKIAIMSTFVRLRKILASRKDPARKLDERERRYDQQFKVVFGAIRKLMEPPAAAPDEMQMQALADDLRGMVSKSGLPVPAIRKVLDMKWLR
jgi:hypothetical protein